MAVGREMNEFKNYHPIVSFTYFTAVIAFSMIFMHPVCLAISFFSGFLHSIVRNGRRALKFQLFCLLPLIVITAFINPAFNHEGVTILCYLPDDNPLTLESIVYGIAAAVMLAAVVCHFSCFNKIMTSDKLMYLFGKVVPSLSLVLSMVLRLIPRFREQMKAVSNAQKGVGRSTSDGGVIKRAKNGIKILSVVITWSLENAIDTADSMKSRGYGLSGRTAFSNFKFEKRDAGALVVISLSTIYVLLGGIFQGVAFRYFPSMKGVDFSPYSISLMLVYLLLCFVPMLIEVKEVLAWKHLKSKI